MGGKDVIYMKQQHSSTLQPADVQKRLKEMADKRFLNSNSPYNVVLEQVYQNEKVGEETIVIFIIFPITTHFSSMYG